MMRLQNVPPEQMNEVVRIAGELYDRDRVQVADSVERQNVVQAATEVGIPPEYMERAAEEHQNRLIAQARERNQRKNRNIIIGTTVAAVAVVGGLLVARNVSTGRTPITAVAAQAATVSVEGATPFVTPGTNASVRTENGALIIQVNRFGPDPKGTYNVNANVKAPGNLSAYRNLSFNVRGTGLSKVRVDFENGPTERWRSPNISVNSGGNNANIPFSQFEHQTRPGENDRWRVVGKGDVGDAKTLTFKVGDTINTNDASGQVSVDSITLK